MNRKTSTAVLLAIFLVATIAPSINYVQSAEVPNGPWVDEIDFQAEPDWAKVVNMLKNNDVQIHLSEITDPVLVRDIKASPNLQYTTAYGLFFELTFNPHGDVIDPEFVDGRFNPFCNPKIREAVNYLVDRDHIVNEIMAGWAKKKLLSWVSAFPDYGRLADTMKLLENQYKHDFEKAKTIIYQELGAMGAKLSEGKWYYKNQPITLKMLIRIEDQRRQIGDYVSGLFERLGFLTERSYKPSREASPIWNQGDPSKGLFHVYTGGWISTAVSRDDSGDFAFFYTPLGLATPLWQAYKPDPIFFEVANKLNVADWKTFDERQALMRQAVALALKDSVRVFLVDQVSPYVSRKELAVAGDLSGGFSNPIWSRTLKYKTGAGRVVKASDREVVVEPWNPVAGTNWAYDTHLFTNIVEADYIYNPYTGLPMPNTFQNATVSVLKGNPAITSSSWCTLKFVDSISVPSDTLYEWDVTAKSMKGPPAGATSLAKVTINYGDVIGKVKYHDGSVMSLADWLITIPIDYERANPNSTIYDQSSKAGFSTFKQIWKGMKVVSEHPLVIDYYLDYTNLDAELIVAQACATPHYDSPVFSLSAIWPTMPWQTYAIGLKAEEKKLLAFSKPKSNELKVEWMSYWGGPSLNVLADMLTEAKNTVYIPFAKYLGNYITAQDASTRYQNLDNFAKAHGHYFVGNGPFYLDRIDVVGHIAVLKANRNYPFKADRWDWLAEPPIPESSVSAPTNVVPGLKADFTLSLTTKGQPYSNDRIDFVKYVVIGSAGDIVASGNAVPGAQGKWGISINETRTAKLTAGTYTLMTIALSKDVATPGVLETPFTVIPELSYFQSLLAQKEASLNAAISGLQTALNARQQDIASLQGAISSLQTTTYASIGVAIIGVAIAVFAVLTSRKK